MKRSVLSVLISTLTILAAFGQDLPASDEKMINDYVNSKITIRKEKIESDALSRVFTGAFYRALPSYNHKDGISSCSGYNIVVHNGTISELEEISETKSLDLLFSLLNNDFTIKDENDAGVFEKALDSIYPLTWSDKEEDKKHFLKDGKWFFIRGEFFDSQKGFVLTLNQNFRISRIDYDLEAIEKQ